MTSSYHEIAFMRMYNDLVSCHLVGGLDPKTTWNECTLLHQHSF